MQLSFGRHGDRKLGIIIVTGSCCIPGMAPFDEQARRTVEQAISETGVAASVKLVAGSSAFMGGVPAQTMAELMAGYSKTGRLPVPAIFINGKLIAFGVPVAKLEDIKAALLQNIDTKATTEERVNE